MVRWKLLSPDLKVSCKIYEYSNVKEGEIWFSKLVKVLDGDVSKVTISKSLDRLYDLGIIDGEWKKVEKRWIRTFKIAGEALDFIRDVYNGSKV